MQNADLDGVFSGVNGRSGEAQPDREQRRRYAARDRRSLHVDAPDEFKNAGFFGHALGNDGIKGPELEEMLNPLVHFFADKYRCPGLLVQALKTRGKINGVAERRIIHALG